MRSRVIIHYREKIKTIYKEYPFAEQQRAVLIYYISIISTPLILMLLAALIYITINEKHRLFQLLSLVNITLIFFCCLGMIFAFVTVMKGKIRISKTLASLCPTITMIAVITSQLIGIILGDTDHSIIWGRIAWFIQMSTACLSTAVVVIILNKRKIFIVLISVVIVESLILLYFVSKNFIYIQPPIIIIQLIIIVIIFSICLLYYSWIVEKSFSIVQLELLENKELNANLEQKVLERTRRIKNIESSLRKYLPRQLVENITKGHQIAEPRTERRKLTVFFSDIKGFTDLTESMEAEDMATLLNEYLTEMTNIAHKWGGTVDKFIGDAIMIFFGAPGVTPDKDNAINCVRMAIEMQEKMNELQSKWFHEGIENPLEIRIGISTGTATIGNFGAEDRLSYTVIGTQVNIASRLEGICEPNGIKISHPTWALINEEIKCTTGEKVNVKGIHREIVTYNVVL